MNENGAVDYQSEMSCTCIVLCGGLGSRLETITQDKPKCAVNVAGASILHRLVAQLSHASADAHIVVVTGYRAADVETHLAELTLPRVRTVHNPQYESTNNMFSLSRAFGSEIADKPVLVMNGDLVYDVELVRNMLLDRNDAPDLAILTDLGTWDAESMKVSASGDGTLSGIRKTFSAEESVGRSCDLYRFTASAFARFKGVVHTHLDAGNVKDWTEVAIEKFMGSNCVRPVPTRGKSWVEIDNADDLALAWSTFGAQLPTAIRRVYCDIDGTTHVGSSPIPGAVEMLRSVAALDVDVRMITNNSSRVPADFSSEFPIYSSLDATCDALKHWDVAKPLYVLGSPPVCRYLIEKGVPTTRRVSAAAGVLVTFDMTLDRAGLDAACAILARSPSVLMATHKDTYCPTPEGPIVDCGAITAMLERVTGKHCCRTFGKPSRCFIPEEHCNSSTLVIGDRLGTDGALASATDTSFALVLTGETTIVDVERLNPTCCILSSLASLALPGR